MGARDDPRHALALERSAKRLLSLISEDGEYDSLEALGLVTLSFPNHDRGALREREPAYTRSECRQCQ